jgi:hypothetical protein
VDLRELMLGQADGDLRTGHTTIIPQWNRGQTRMVGRQTVSGSGMTCLESLIGSLGTLVSVLESVTSWIASNAMGQIMN